MTMRKHGQHPSHLSSRFLPSKPQHRWHSLGSYSHLLPSPCRSLSYRPVFWFYHRTLGYSGVWCLVLHQAHIQRFLAYPSPEGHPLGTVLFHPPMSGRMAGCGISHTVFPNPYLSFQDRWWGTHCSPIPVCNGSENHHCIMQRKAKILVFANFYIRFCESESKEIVVYDNKRKVRIFHLCSSAFFLSALMMLSDFCLSACS